MGALTAAEASKMPSGAPKTVDIQPKVGGFGDHERVAVKVMKAAPKGKSK